MIRKYFSWPIFALFFFLLFLLHLSPSSTMHLRGSAATLFSRVWKPLAGKGVDNTDIALKELELENRLLQEENNRLKRYALATQLPVASDRFLQAHILYRSPSSWGSSLWIDIGSSDNIDSPIVARYSPVVFGPSLIGLIDYVGEKISRVRLLTDTSFSASVRVAREADKRLYLAKGEISGYGAPLWNPANHRLKGVGFNYDFPDFYGEARDLRTGLPLGSHNGTPIPLIEEGDLLVTTGLDGIFPPGLSVGHVTGVAPLKEGDYAYEIEATPAVRNMDELTFLFVLPPCSRDPEELCFPSIPGKKF